MVPVLTQQAFQINAPCRHPIFAEAVKGECGLVVAYCDTLGHQYQQCHKLVLAQQEDGYSSPVSFEFDLKIDQRRLGQLLFMLGIMGHMYQVEPAVLCDLRAADGVGDAPLAYSQRDQPEDFPVPDHASPFSGDEATLCAPLGKSWSRSGGRSCVDWWSELRGTMVGKFWKSSC